MSNEFISVVIALEIITGAIPYVAHNRHPRQKPLAAYLIFLTVFVVSVGLLFSLFAWLANTLGLGQALARPLPALLFIALIFLPAGVLASWLAKKPPWQRGPPD